MVKNALVLSFLSVAMMACSKSGGGGSGVRADDLGCYSATPYSAGIRVTGTANYQFRILGNQAVNPTPNPIRFAQVAVHNGAGLKIQCGATDANGNFNLLVPGSSTDTYTLRINSQMYNNTHKVAVYNDPHDELVHFISTTFSPTADTAVGTLTAPATGNLAGGAFNILDKIVEANSFLMISTANCSSQFAACTPVASIPFLRVYWAKGVNPGSYFGVDGASFYVRSYRELYITGGQSGDVDNSDTDHYDTSIILHEYGHFVEDVFSVSDSPGGYHDGNRIIDPRLAFGEAWGNFFQAAVTGVPLYRDTYGNTDTPGNLTGATHNDNLETSIDDLPSVQGEGNFREMSITRLLWDAIDTNNEGVMDTVTSPFSEIWTVFASPTVGFKSTQYRFRNIGLFHQMQKSLPGASDWSSLRTAEKQNDSQIDYARPVAKGSCSAVSIQAASIPGTVDFEDGSAENSNQFASNDFYQFFHPGGVFNFQLNYSIANPNQPPDLDVYIFSQEYNFLDIDSVVAASTNLISVPSTAGAESIYEVLPAGYYMINIRVDTTARLGSAASYSMRHNGALLCPL